MALLMTGCGDSGDANSQSGESDSAMGDPGSEASTASCEPDGPVEISAADTAFDKECLAALAGEKFNVTFNNKDAFGHSFAVYDKQGGEQLFRGEIFSGPKELVNEIPSLAAGTYYFQCDVHPFPMQGVLKVA